MNRRLFLLLAATSSLAGSALLSPVHAAPPERKILFFTKSSGYEHEVISWKKGQPSFAEKVLLEMGAKNNWKFTFSKDGSLFSPEYLAQFDAVFFYTTGNLLEPGTDGQPPMTPAGKQALLDYVSGGKGFIGTHSASDTFHTNNESKKGPDRYRNFGEAADPYIRMLGGEFIKHGPQQKAESFVADPNFPNFEKHAPSFVLHEEWYSLKDFAPDLRVLLIQETEGMKGIEYQRPPFPSTWARKHGQGRVFYTSMGHREDVWASPIFQDLLTSGVSWAVGDLDADVTPNVHLVAREAETNPPYPGPAVEKPAPAPAAAPKP